MTSDYNADSELQCLFFVKFSPPITEPHLFTVQTFKMSIEVNNTEIFCVLSRDIDWGHVYWWYWYWFRITVFLCDAPGTHTHREGTCYSIHPPPHNLWHTMELQTQHPISHISHSAPTSVSSINQGLDREGERPGEQGGESPSEA